METDADLGPGSSSIMRRLEEGSRLPWRLVHHSTWTKLANKLDLPSPVSNNDWRGLAERLDFTTENILILETRKERCTLSLFAEYLPRKNSSVNDVAKALKAMNRDDALQILLEAVPELEERYKLESQKKSDLHPVDTNDLHSCGCQISTSPASSYLHHPHHHPHLATQPCGMKSCCCQPSLAPCGSHPGSTTSSLISACHSAGAAGGMSLVYNIPPQTGLLSNRTNGTGGEERKDYYNVSPYRQAERRGMQLHQPARPSGRPIQHLSDYQQSYGESMLVHHDLESHNRRPLQSYIGNNDMEVDGEPVSFDQRGGTWQEEPAHLPATIARGQGLISSALLLPMDSMSDVMVTGEDTPSTSIEELSSSDSGTRLSSLPLNVQVTIKRQVSEECNSKQPNGEPSAGRRAVYDNEGLDSWGKRSNGTRCEATGYDAYRAKGADKSQSSLESLERLSQIPVRYKPGNTFTTIVAEQKIDDPSNGRTCRNPKQEKSETLRACQFLENREPQSLSSTSSRGRRSRAATGADTYPLRVKCQPGGATLEEVRSRQPGTLTKSTSVPIDLKVEEFKKAFHHIRVFVTHTSDSRIHSRQILSLCNCLQKNGFSCWVDVNPKQDSPDSASSIDWIPRFNEADFILVCLSPLYVQEMSKVDEECRSGSNKPVSSKSRPNREVLHAGPIYRLMREEYQTKKNCSRFVLLKVEGAPCGQCPSWMQECVKYQWPSQYKDLLWMLTKPEERIKQRPAVTRPSPGKVHGKVNGMVPSPR